MHLHHPTKRNKKIIILLGIRVCYWLLLGTRVCYWAGRLGSMRVKSGSSCKKVIVSQFNAGIRSIMGGSRDEKEK